jgi:integral membrane sensor domain MASE1
LPPSPGSGCLEWPTPWRRVSVSARSIHPICLNLATYRLAGLGVAEELGVSLVIAAAIALQAFAGSELVHRMLGRQPLLERSGEILRFMLLAGPTACLIGATIGTLTLLQAHLLLPAQADRAWLTWWVGDSIVVIVFAPLVLMLLPSQAPLWRGRRLAVAVPSIVLLALSLAIFARSPDRGTYLEPAPPGPGQSRR